MHIHMHSKWWFSILEIWAYSIRTYITKRLNVFPNKIWNFVSHISTTFHNNNSDVKLLYVGIFYSYFFLYWIASPSLKIVKAHNFLKLQFNFYYSLMSLQSSLCININEYWFPNILVVNHAQMITNLANKL